MQWNTLIPFDIHKTLLLSPLLNRNRSSLTITQTKSWKDGNTRNRLGFFAFLQDSVTVAGANSTSAKPGQLASKAEWAIKFHPAKISIGQSRQLNRCSKLAVVQQAVDKREEKQQEGRSAAPAPSDFPTWAWAAATKFSPRDVGVSHGWSMESSYRRRSQWGKTPQPLRVRSPLASQRARQKAKAAGSKKQLRGQKLTRNPQTAELLLKKNTSTSIRIK